MDVKLTSTAGAWRLLGVMVALALCVVGGCARAPIEPAPPRVTQADVGENGLVKDLIPALGAAKVVRATRVVEPGDSLGRRALLEGWGEPEVHGESGVSFAWAVAKEARIEVVRLDGGPAEIAVTGWPFRWSGSPGQQVDVVVNGTPVGSGPLSRGGSTVTVHVPKGVFRVGLNRIDFKFTYAERPAVVVRGSTDDRVLAAAIQRVEISGSGRDTGIPEGIPKRDGDTLTLPVDTGVSFRHFPSGVVALDLEATAAGGSPDGQPRIVVWQQPVGGEPSVLLDDVVTGRSSGWRLSLAPAATGFSELAVAAVGGGVSVGRLQLVGKPSSQSPRNLLLIVMDTLRADRVGCYGGAASTPAIDGLAASGTLFERAYSHIAITGPSHASMFTSLLPFEHGVHNNAQILAEDHRTLAESLRENGWFTAAVVSLGVLMREYGLAQGFDVYRDDFERDWMKNAGEVTDEALMVINDGLPEPFFLWTHYSDPHEPYTPPGLEYPTALVELDGRGIGEVTADGRGYTFDLELAPGRSHLRFAPRKADPNSWYRVGAVTLRSNHSELIATDPWTVIKDAAGFRTYTAHLPASLQLVNNGQASERAEINFIFKRRLDIPEVKRRYQLEVEYADREIGRLLAGLDRRGLLDNTVVVFTSDHGEGLGDHNHLGHIHQVYDSLIGVPLIVSFRGEIPAGRRVTDRVALVDLFPTVAQILGIEGPTPASGRSLVPLIDGVQLPEPDVIAETYRPEAFTDKRAIIRHGVKFIHSWSDVRGWEELYDLDSDPGELDDLIDRRPELADTLRRALDERLRSSHHGRAEAAELSASDVDRLRALGYVH